MYGAQPGERKKEKQRERPCCGICLRLSKCTVWPRNVIHFFFSFSRYISKLFVKCKFKVKKYLVTAYLKAVKYIYKTKKKTLRVQFSQMIFEVFFFLNNSLKQNSQGRNKHCLSEILNIKIFLEWFSLKQNNKHFIKQLFFGNFNNVVHSVNQNYKVNFMPSIKPFIYRLMLIIRLFFPSVAQFP